MEENNANSVVDTVENANANSQEINQGTLGTDNPSNSTLESVAQVVDYEKKFIASSKEAQRLYEENKALREAIEQKETQGSIQKEPSNTDSLYPGFEELSEEERQNILAFSEAVSKRTTENLKKDPAYSFALKQYNEKVWDSAFNSISSKYPELVNEKDVFKSKYYNVNNVPSNIEEILDGLAKIHLFDKAKSIGAKEAEELSKRIELERTSSKPIDSVKTKRTLEDWQKMSEQNPAKFAALREEFNDDLKSGRI